MGNLSVKYLVEIVIVKKAIGSVTDPDAVIEILPCGYASLISMF